MADGVGQDGVEDGVGVLQQLRHATEGRPLDEMPPEHCPAVAAVRSPTQIFVRHFFSTGVAVSRNSDLLTIQQFFREMQNEKK